MDEMDLHGRLAAQSLLTSLALALATRDSANPSDDLKEVVDSMKSTVETAKAALPKTASPDYSETFIAVFNSELEQVKSMAATMLVFMGVEQD